MRKVYLATGVGAFSVASFVSAAGLPFETLVTDGGFGTLDTVRQVVLSDGKKVAAIIDASANTVVIYKQQSDAGSFAILAAAYGSAFDSPGYNFETFSNLAFTGSRVVFSADAADPSGSISGAFGRAVGGSGYKLLADHDLSNTFAYHNVAGITVNAAGSVLISGKINSAEVIMLAGQTGPSGATTVINDSGSIQAFNSPTPPRGTKKVFTGSGSGESAVFLAENGRGKGIIQEEPIGNAASAATRVTEGLVNFGPGVYYDARPTQLLGATPTGTLYAATLTASSGGPTVTGGDNALIYDNGSSSALVHQFSNPSGDAVRSEVTATGKAAFTIGDSVYYFDPVTSVAQEIAHSGLSVNGSTIGTIDTVSAPMVNEHGLVVFQAEMTGTGSDNTALLAWTGTGLIELAREGGTITIDGVTQTVQYLANLGLNDGGQMPFDFDPTKDGLSEDNHVAFGVTYNGVNAIVVTAVPEPSVAMGLVLGLPALSLRRRRR